MANITQLINNIRTAVFGKDVRESIASAIEQTYEDASEHGNANMEVVDARGTFDTLKNRLDNSDSIKADNSKIENLQSQINGLASGSPLVASSTSEMTDTTKVYVNTSDGKWYYYDGDSWEIGGTYQSTGLVTDKTLKVNNSAADSASVGSILSTLKLNEEVIPLTWKTGKYNDDGTIGSNSATARTVKASINGSYRLKVNNFSNWRNIRIVLFDENDVYLHTTEITDSTYYIQHKGYFGFQTWKSDLSNFTEFVTVKNDFVFKKISIKDPITDSGDVYKIPTFFPKANGNNLSNELNNLDFYKYQFTPIWGHEYLTSWYKKIYEGGTGNTVNVVLAGDSITEGYGPQYSGVDDAFIGMRDRWIKKIMKVGGFPLNKLRVINTGHGGKTTNEFVGNADSNAGASYPYGYLHNAMGNISQPFTPHLLIIAYGMNDANRHFDEKTIEERLVVYETNMREALGRIRGNTSINDRPAYNKSLSELSIIICNPTMANIPETGRSNELWFQHLRTINQKLCREFYCAFVDFTARTFDHLADGSNNWATLNSDGTAGNIHPNKWADANIFSMTQDLIFPVGLWNIDID